MLYGKRRLISAIMLGIVVSSGSINTAMAATKFVNTREQNLSFTDPIGPVTICGVTDTFTETLHIGQFSFVSWDNDHSMIRVTGFQDKFYDSNGNLIAIINFNQKIVKGSNSLPLTEQFNDIGICAGGSAMPGMQFNVHMGMTINEEGMLKEVHVVQVS